MEISEVKICVVGLGYVGLPLARLFSTKFETIGFDLNQQRVDALMQGHAYSGDSRSPIPMISVHSVGDLLYRRQS